MYSTRVFHPKVAESYLSIGDPYEKIGGTRTVYKGKQFQTNPAKQGQQGGYFGEFKYNAVAYADTNSYRITQPKDKRKTGFGTGDANRRDEFTLDIRAQQYKELLTKELQFQAKKAAEEKESGNGTGDSLDEFKASNSARFSASSTGRGEPVAGMFQTQVPNHLFDIGRTAITPICNKCSRETFYCPHRVNSQGSDTLRRLGPLKTSAMEVGSEIHKHNMKPPHGKRSQLKDFFDNNHLSVTRD